MSSEDVDRDPEMMFREQCSLTVRSSVDSVEQSTCEGMKSKPDETVSTVR